VAIFLNVLGDFLHDFTPFSIFEDTHPNMEEDLGVTIVDTLKNGRFTAYF